MTSSLPPTSKAPYPYPTNPRFSEPQWEAFWNVLNTTEAHVFLETSASGLLEAVLPEWQRMRDPQHNTQHRTHDFTLDVHTAYVLVNTRRAKGFDALSLHWQHLVVLAALLHDIAKDGGSPEQRNTLWPDAEHPEKGVAVVQHRLPEWGFSTADTDRVAQLVRYHQLFGRMIIRHDALGHPPTPATYAETAQLLPDAALIKALVPLTEGDIRAVKAEDALFTPHVADCLHCYSQGVLTMLEHQAPEA
jgi:UTP:GlnB (protein PII) uridylyltransferase